jgi:methionine-gamma-lyase
LHEFRRSYDKEVSVDDTTGGMRPESMMMSLGHDPHRAEGSVKVPLYQTSTFEFASAAEGKAFFATKGRGYIYSRLDNPNLRVAEDRLRVWDGAEHCLLFGSGMSAISTTLLATLRPGDVLVHSHPLYGCTDFIATTFLHEFGITPVAVTANMSEPEVEAAIDAAAPGARLGVILLETPANPTLDLFDLDMFAAIAHRRSDATHRAILAVDNTFLGPMWQRPLEHGADLVIYSATKYIGGHSDLVAGAVLGNAAMTAPIAHLRADLGTTASPEVAWLITRSLETLQVRTDRQLENAQRIAGFLHEHPKISHLRYLGFLEPGTRAHDVFKGQCLAAGALIAFEFDGGEAAAYRFLDSLHLVKLAVSLGSTESLAEHPGTMTHASVDEAVKVRLGITPGLVRLSIGIEAPDDLIADLANALNAV